MITATLLLPTWLPSLLILTNKLPLFRCPVSARIDASPTQANRTLVNAVRIQKMMQAAGVPATGQVAIAVAQRGVLQNPGGATGNLGGAAAVQRRGLSRREFRKEVARQVQAGTPTNNNPVATQLLLAPTFTPVQADAVLDQTNMRIAIPVRQVDGEFILTMQVMEGGQGQAQAAPEGQRPEGQQPAAAEGQAPAAESQTPTAEAPASSSSAEAAQPTAEGASNSTEPAKAERRQESNTDKYGLPKPAQGAVIMTMKQIDDMANAVLWAGQAPITQMMNDYVKAQTGQGLSPVANATSEATAKIVV